MMRKKPVYKSRSNEARRNRRIARSARNKGEKSHAYNASDDVSAKLLELGKDAVGETPGMQILRDLMNDADPRVRLPAVRLMLKLAPPSEVSTTVSCSCQRVRKPWPFADGLGTEVNEMARRYQMMISGDFDMPQSMESLHAEATYLSIMPELAIALVAKHKAEAAKKLEPPLPPPPRPEVEVLRPAGLPLPEDVPHGTKAKDVEDAVLVNPEAALDEVLRVQRPPRVLT
jgi:hypothetical protein